MIEKKELIIDIIDPNLKTISVVLYEIVELPDGRKFETKGPRRAFFPGQITQLEEWINGCEDKQLVLDICGAMWTQEVIDKYTNSLFVEN